MSKYEKIKLLSALLLPYIFFAIICMLYNKLRFESCFDFGVAYNTTSIPVREKELFLPYAIFRSVYDYLLYPPYISFSFPHTKFAAWQVIKEAGNTMVRDVFCGGLIVSNPFIWSLALTGYYRKSLKKKKILGIMLAGFSVAFFIMVYGTICTSSIYTRYTMDFSSAVLIGASIVILEIYDDISVMKNERLRENLEKVIAFVLMISILWGAMQFCCGEKSIWSLEAGNTELWGRIYYAFRLFG